MIDLLLIELIFKAKGCSLFFQVYLNSYIANYYLIIDDFHLFG